VRRMLRQRSQDEEEEEEADEEATDDEDSDDGERELLEERLRAEDEADGEELRAVGEDPTLAPGGGQDAAASASALRAPHLASTAGPVDYQIAIPTHGRWRPVREMTRKQRFKDCDAPFILVHTLEFLTRQGIPVERVSLFVADGAEAQSYRRALSESAWADVRIVTSVLGNKNNRNFIFRHFPAGTYVISVDDDVERIAWKFRDGITNHVLRSLPPGGFEKIIFDAYERMQEKDAFLWGLNTSQNPRHMRGWGMSVMNGLVNGYLNGFICRPQCPELLRTLTDATEDSEFAVRHYAKDGVVLRYRMYAGITSPYLNRGGLQTKFEKEGEQITSQERSAARKIEERWGATELHKLFPRLIGPPCPRGDRKTMEVTFYPLGYPTGEGSKRKMIYPRLFDEDCIEYKPNPKRPGSESHKLYERYKRATTVRQARELGARPIDLAFDSNWGYLTVTRLSVAPVPVREADRCEVRHQGAEPSATPSVVAGGQSEFVKVRVREMSEGHKGLAVARAALAQLAARCPGLREVPDEVWASMEEGPLKAVPLTVLRALLCWAETGTLTYERHRTKAVHLALKACGASDTARAVKRLEAAQAAGQSAVPSGCAAAQGKALAAMGAAPGRALAASKASKSKAKRKATLGARDGAPLHRGGAHPCRGGNREPGTPRATLAGRASKPKVMASAAARTAAARKKAPGVARKKALAARKKAPGVARKKALAARKGSATTIKIGCLEKESCEPATRAKAWAGSLETRTTPSLEFVQSPVEKCVDVTRMSAEGKASIAAAAGARAKEAGVLADLSSDDEEPLSALV